LNRGFSLGEGINLKAKQQTKQQDSKPENASCIEITNSSRAHFVSDVDLSCDGLRFAQERRFFLERRQAKAAKYEANDSE
jgi:hypothetical protein